MKKRVLFAAAAAAAVLCMALPAAAETFTSEDGVLSIELPDDSWKEMEDSSKWIVLSDGGNVITIDHFSNGEQLPDIAVADSHYVNVYQAAFSSQNEVFIITGYLADAGKLADIAKTIVSAKLLKYDTKLAVKKEEKQQSSGSGFTIAATDSTMYVTSDGLNVRSGYSTDDGILGGLSYGASVKVTGVVQKDGQDYGWYQISFNGSTGYVSANFLSTSAPAQKAETEKSNASLKFTGNVVTVYAPNGTAISIREGEDGKWYDSIGVTYDWVSGSEVQTSNGDVFTTYNSNSNSDPVPTNDSFVVYWENGNGDTLTRYTDGNLYSSSGVMYADAGNGIYSGYDGTTLYVYEPDLTSGTQHGLSSQGSGRPVTVNTDEYGTYRDADGLVYYGNGDGTWTCENGDVFNEEW